MATTSFSADHLSMSLDDIIDKSKSARRGGRGGNHGRSRNSAPYQRPQRDNRPPLTTASSGPTKILVSNLGFHVTSEDAKELFSQIGAVKQVILNFNEQGRSTGTATVIYQNGKDAARAVSEYHNRTLDGRAMKIELLVNPDSVASLGRDNSSRPRRDDSRTGEKRGGRGGFRGGRFRRGGSFGGDRKAKPTKTAGELDAEMESYMKDEEMVDAAA